MARLTTPLTLTADQQTRSEQIFLALQRAAAKDLRAMAELLVATDDRDIFGATEFAVRDMALGIGAKAIEAALEERKKRATGVRLTIVPLAKGRRSSNAGNPNPW